MVFKVNDRVREGTKRCRICQAAKPQVKFYIAKLRKVEKFKHMKVTSKPESRKVPADFRKSADVFKALSNPNRLLIVDALGGGEHCVADLTKMVGLEMSTVSNHLSVLRSVGLVLDERRGTQVFYTLRSSCVLKILDCLDEFRKGGF